jgi:signal transduction histidine kinase/ligand-binding sensor domain-containing protein/DNA-binding response OmpR family regulator
MKNKIAFISLLVFFLSGLHPVQAGKFYSIDYNLLSSSTHRIIQDKQGFVWIATQNGLNKFDGYKFTVYKSKKDDSTALINNYVRTVFEDSKGIIWVGCINGLMKYDRISDTFEEIKIYKEGKRIGPHIISIIEADNGEIWATMSGYGLLIIDREHGDTIKDTSNFTTSLSSNFLTYIYNDVCSHIWIGTSKHGVNRIDALTGEMKIYRMADGLSDDGISVITGNKEGFVFIATSRNGLNVYNPFLDKIYQASCEGLKEPLQIASLLLISENELLVGTARNGLKIYNVSENKMKDYPVNNVPIDISNENISSIMKDRQGNLWLSIHRKGIVFISAMQNKFEYIGFKSFSNNPIGKSPINAIYRDNSGILWVGTNRNGLYGLDKSNGRMAHYIQSSTVQAVFEDSNHDFWIGTATQGLAKIDRKTGAHHFIPELKNQYISSICEDKEKHLLVGTNGSGVYLLDISGSGRTTVNYRTQKKAIDNNHLDELANDWVQAIHCDREGLIWIGHYRGLSCFNPDGKTFLNYGDENTIFDGVVLSLFEDVTGNIYAGTKDGLYYFNKQDTTLSLYTTDNGLSDDVICGIASDSDNNLWLSTYKGLNKLNVKTGNFTNYYARDGLQANEFSIGAVFKDQQGVIYFGGVYGVTYFSPALITDAPVKYDIFITDFYVNNTSVRKGDLSGNREIMSGEVIESDTFTLSSKDNVFGFDLSTLDFADIEQITFQYKIEKLNTNWIMLPHGVNRITITNLSPGKYTIKIRAFVNGTYSDGKQIYIIITPPWYQTAWAYCIYAALLFLLILGITNYILSRIRYRRDIREKEHAKAISEAKLQFFINISHEIRTPMTLIITPLEKLINENIHSHEREIHLLIYRNAQRILRLVNQIMDIRKLDKGQMRLTVHQTDIVGFIKDIMDTFGYLAEKKNIRFTFDHVLEHLNVWIDMNSFDKVLMNIFSNAFKYTPDNGEIRISLATGNNVELGDYFEIKISDSGMGIDKNEIEKIFDRFYQVNNNYSNFGTGVGLHLSRLLVDLHKGVIYAENKENEPGSVFIVRLPLGKDHFDADCISLSPRIAPAGLPEVLPLNDLYEPEADNNDVVQSACPKTKYHILVIDDDLEIRSYLKSELSPEYFVHTCEDGKEGLDYILRKIPDLVLSDVMMPHMDGITLTKRIKTNINISHIPVILLTAKNTIQDRLEGLKTEADAYFDKPFNLAILKQTINNLISNRRKLKNKYSGNEKPEQLMQAIEKKSFDEILMEKIMKVINEHLASPDLNVQMLSDSVSLSRGHLHRKLKELTNQSASDFIRSIRLKQAADLLASKKISISEVVYTTGFSSLSYFSSVFKEFYGMSPKEYVAKNSGSPAKS